jgi:serine/threonine-protein kinase RsbW
MAMSLSACYQIDLPSDAAVIPSVRRRVSDHLRANGFGEDDICGITQALEEALLNAISHGNRGDPARRVRVVYGTADGVFHVRVRDEGPGFDPAAVPDPTRPENRERPDGRGLLLMRHYMSWVQFLGPGNELLMWKRRGGRPPVV